MKILHLFWHTSISAVPLPNLQRINSKKPYLGISGLSSRNLSSHMIWQSQSKGFPVRSRCSSADQSAADSGRCPREFSLRFSTRRKGR